MLGARTGLSGADQREPRECSSTMPTTWTTAAGGDLGSGGELAALLVERRPVLG